MKEIKEEIKREVIDTITKYQAADGTIFTDKEECEKYEASAAGTLMARLTTNGAIEVNNQFDDGGENSYKYFSPCTQQEIDLLNQLWFLFGGKNKEQARFSDKDLDTPILIGYRFYNERIDWLWFYKLNDYIKEVTAGNWHLETNA